MSNTNVHKGLSKIVCRICLSKCKNYKPKYNKFPYFPRSAQKKLDKMYIPPHLLYENCKHYNITKNRTLTT